MRRMKVHATKTTKINKVLYAKEAIDLIDTLKHTKFSTGVDEFTDICNVKWMAVNVHFVSPIEFRNRTQLLQLMKLDASNCTAEALFTAFHNDLIKKQIPFANIVGNALDNCNVMLVHTILLLQ